MPAELEVVRVADGDVEVELLPALGGRIHRIRAYGHDLLRTPAELEAHRREPVFWGAPVMAPWCNRIEATSTAVAGRVVDVPATFPDGTAIHGLVLAAPWTDRGDGRLAVAGGGPETGWPWRFEVSVTASVEDAVLGLALEVANISDEPMPAGIGIHPWFVRPLDVRVPAASVYPSNTASAARAEPVSGWLDLRERREMPRWLDATWTDPEPGRPIADLWWPELGVSAELEVATSIVPAAPAAAAEVTAPTGAAAPRACLVAASPDDPDAIAIEPQTHGPDGLRRLLRGEPDAMILLPPAATLRLDTTWRFTHAPG